MIALIGVLLVVVPTGAAAIHATHLHPRHYAPRAPYTTLCADDSTQQPPIDVDSRPTNKDLREQLQNLGVSTDHLFDRRDLEELLQLHASRATRHAEGARRQAAAASRRAPVEAMRTDAILDELESLGADADVLAPRAVLIQRLHQARDAWDAHVASSTTAAGSDGTATAPGGGSSDPESVASQLARDAIDDAVEVATMLTGNAASFVGSVARATLDATASSASSSAPAPGSTSPSAPAGTDPEGAVDLPERDAVDDAVEAATALTGSAVSLVGSAVRAALNVASRTGETLRIDDANATAVGNRTLGVKYMTQRVGNFLRRGVGVARWPHRPIWLKASLLVACLCVVRFGLARTLVGLLGSALAWDLILPARRAWARRRAGERAANA